MCQFSRMGPEFRFLGLFPNIKKMKINKIIWKGIQAENINKHHLYCVHYGHDYDFFLNLFQNSGSSFL